MSGITLSAYAQAVLQHLVCVSLSYMSRCAMSGYFIMSTCYFTTSVLFLCSNICTFYYYVHDLLLYRPNSDTCKTCDSLQTCLTAEENAAEQRELEDELQLHKCKAERAYQQPKEDGALSRSSPMVDMFSFDVQQS